MKQLSPLVTQILSKNPSPFTLGGTNTFILGKNSKRLLIDTGSSDSAAQWLDELLEIMNREKFQLAAVLLTHWHHDHTGGLHPLQKRIGYDLPVFKWRTDLSGEAESKQLIELSDAESEDGAEFHFERDARPASIPVSRFVGESCTLSVLKLPGHSLDHACFRLHEENSLFR